MTIDLRYVFTCFSLFFVVFWNGFCYSQGKEKELESVPLKTTRIITLDEFLAAANQGKCSVNRSQSTGEVVGVKLDWTLATDDNIKFLAEIPSLRELKISCGKDLSHKGILEIARLSSIAELNLGLTPRQELPNDFFPTLSKNPNLKILQLRFCKLAEMELAGIEKCGKLKELKLLSVEGMSSKSYVSISVLPSLESLELVEIDPPLKMTDLKSLKNPKAIRLEFKQE